MRAAEASEQRLDTAGGEDLLDIDGLTVGFGLAENVLRDVSFSIRRGEIVALVGESGCGKTLTALAILGLLPGAAQIVTGRINLADAGDLLALDERRRREVRARRLAMIFQEPMSALNPVLTLGFQVGESLRVDRNMSRTEARGRALELLTMVAMPDPSRRLNCYPHQLSGGQLQRAMIAMALANAPDLLLADEPTTALDVTVQAQVLDLILKLRDRLGLAVLLITHDLGVVAQCADRVLVMYCGQIIEQATVEDLYRHPAHPYTRALLAAVPRLDGEAFDCATLPGEVPESGNFPPGCAYHPRCKFAMSHCPEEQPDLSEVRSVAIEEAESTRARQHTPGARCSTAAMRHMGRCFLLQSDDRNTESK